MFVRVTCELCMVCMWLCLSGFLCVGKCVRVCIIVYLCRLSLIVCICANLFILGELGQSAHLTKVIGDLTSYLYLYIYSFLKAFGRGGALRKIFSGLLPWFIFNHSF